jgi:hypothetical protein
MRQLYIVGAFLLVLVLATAKKESAKSNETVTTESPSRLPRSAETKDDQDHKSPGDRTKRQIGLGANGQIGAQVGRKRRDLGLDANGQASVGGIGLGTDVNARVGRKKRQISLGANTGLGAQVGRKKRQIGVSTNARLGANVGR